MLVYQYQAQPLSPASPLFEFPQEKRSESLLIIGYPLVN